MKFAFAIVSFTLLAGAFAQHDAKFDGLFARGKKILNKVNATENQAKASGHSERMSLFQENLGNFADLKQQMDNRDRMGPLDIANQNNQPGSFFTADYIARLSSDEFETLAARMEAEQKVYDTIFGDVSDSTSTVDALRKAVPGLLADVKSDQYANRREKDMTSGAEQLLKDLETEGFNERKATKLMEKLVYINRYHHK